ncbi:hypothetical protein TELCIR_25060 [Teladorsagia circumcincta]|uniref:Uncharacterized protein n=1 Tax=Teladorsagia circumcincta TaxID=45464 RepID=A0A2G9T6K0_TELCI|nr:hypothetical protein TELCIR_25060 [Teladorsagia circumcincta]
MRTVREKSNLKVLNQNHLISEFWELMAGESD